MAQASHDVCSPVQATFGDDPIAGMYHDDPAMDAYSLEEAGVAAANAIAGTPDHLYRDSTLTPAGRTLMRLGCTACTSHDACLVRRQLGEIDQLAQGSDELAQMEVALKSAPDWLDRARTGNFPGGKARRYMLRNDPHARAAAWESGELRQLFSSIVSCKALPPTDKHAVAGLANIGTISDNDQLPVHEVVTASGYTFHVVDASRVLGNKPIEPDNLGTLLAKFIARMNAPVNDRETQIERPDNDAEKPILTRPGVTVLEMRQSGTKSRLYFALEKGADPTRITLLGYHGSDEKAQARAIGNIVGTAPGWTRIN